MFFVGKPALVKIYKNTNTMKENKLFQKLKALVSLFLPYCNTKAFIKTTGRKLSLPITDFVTLGLFKHLQGILTKKSVYDVLNLSALCSYKTLVVNMIKTAPIAKQIIEVILNHNKQFAHIIKHTDSTEIPVCLKKNMDSHKTMKELATMSKSSKGWYYGMKMHLTADFNGKMLEVRITTANASDRKTAKEMNKNLWGTIIMDSGYVSYDLQDEMNIEGKRRWFVKPTKRMKKLATILENLTYNTRMMIESFFRDLKLFRVLVSSIPRSVNGYLANYVYAIFAEAMRPLLSLNPEVLLLQASNNKTLVTV